MTINVSTLLKTAGAVAIAGLVAASPASAKMVGGAEMYPSKTIVQNASTANNLTTLVAAVKAAGLVDTLQGSGPFTVFAPTDAAFAELPAGTVQTLTQPENKAKLTSILTYHVVPGNMSGAAILAKVNAMGGKATMKTVQGETLTAVKQGQGLAVIDQNGNKAVITTADVDQSNGVVHVINRVLMP